jgi:ATP-dependent DNA ligase
VGREGAASPLPERLRGRRDDTRVFLSAFDLLELDGVDWRGEPIEHRKASLAVLLRGATPGLQINEDIAEPGDIVVRHACALGLEGIVSKRLGSRYRSGRSRDWIKSKNPAAPAVKREAEEGLGAVIRSTNHVEGWSCGAAAEECRLASFWSQDIAFGAVAHQRRGGGSAWLSRAG